jgi:hypothetical protein
MTSNYGNINYLIERLSAPNLSYDNESAPHYITTQSGLNVSITLLVTFLNSSKYGSSAIPGFKGTLTA